MTEFEDNQSRTICLLNNKREVALVLYKDYSVEQLPLKLYRSKCLNVDVQVLLDFAMQSTKDFLREEPSNSFNYHLAEFILDECVCNFDRIFPLREETKLFSTLKTESLLLIKTLGRNSHLYNGMKYLLFLYYFECHYSLVIVAKGQSEDFNVAIHYDPHLQSCTSARVFSNFKTIFPNLSYFYCLGGDQNNDDWSSAHRCLSFVCWHFCDIKIQDQDFSRLISTLKHSEGQTSIPSKNRGIKRCMYCLLRTNSICFNCRRPFCYEPVCNGRPNTNLCRECFFSKEAQHIEEHYILPTKKRKLDAFVEKENSAFESSIVSGNVDLASVQCDKNVAKCVNRKRTKTKHNLDKSFEKEICQLKSSISNDNFDLLSKACKNDESEIGKNQTTEKLFEEESPVNSVNNVNSSNVETFLKQPITKKLCQSCNLLSDKLIMELACQHIICKSCLSLEDCIVCKPALKESSQLLKEDSSNKCIEKVLATVGVKYGVPVNCPICGLSVNYKNFLTHLEGVHKKNSAVMILRNLRLFERHYNTSLSNGVPMKKLKICPSCQKAYLRLDNHIEDTKKIFSARTCSLKKFVKMDVVGKMEKCTHVQHNDVPHCNFNKLVDDYLSDLSSKVTLKDKFYQFISDFYKFDEKKTRSIVSMCKRLINKLFDFDEVQDLNSISQFFSDPKNSLDIRNTIRSNISSTGEGDNNLLGPGSARTYLSSLHQYFSNFLFTEGGMPYESKKIFIEDMLALQTSHEKGRALQTSISKK